MLDMRMAYPSLIQIHTGRTEHRVICIEPYGALIQTTEKFQDASRTGSEVDQKFDRLGPEKVEHGSLDFGYGLIESADPDPFPRMGFKVSGSFPGTDSFDLCQSFQVARNHRIPFVEPFDEHARQIPGSPSFPAVGQTVKNPRTFWKSRYKATVQEQFQMSADSGLALAQYLADLSNGQFSVRQKMDQSQTCRFGDRSQVMHGTQQGKIGR